MGKLCTGLEGGACLINALNVLPGGRKSNCRLGGVGESGRFQIFYGVAVKVPSLPSDVNTAVGGEMSPVAPLADVGQVGMDNEPLEGGDKVEEVADVGEARGGSVEAAPIQEVITPHPLGTEPLMPKSGSSLWKLLGERLSTNDIYKSLTEEGKNFVIASHVKQLDGLGLDKLFQDYNITNKALTIFKDHGIKIDKFNTKEILEAARTRF